MQIIEETIEATGPLNSLFGTLTRTANSTSDVVLIIPGSGPTDRDGNNPLGVKAAPYRLLAEGLARCRVQSVRIDKRGMFASKAAIPDANDVTIGEYADDVTSWIDAIRRKVPGAKIWLLGHSEGGLVSMVAAKRAVHISGLILLSSPGRKIGNVMREQFTDNPANQPILEDALSAIDQLEGGNHVDVTNFHPALQPVFYPEVQNYLMDIMSYDPVVEIQKLKTPILILQGDKDFQVRVEDAEKLSKFAPHAVLSIIPNMNHVLKQIMSDDMADNFATYSEPDLPLAAGLLDRICEFIDS